MYIYIHIYISWIHHIPTFFFCFLCVLLEPERSLCIAVLDNKHVMHILLVCGPSGQVCVFKQGQDIKTTQPSRADSLNNDLPGNKLIFIFNPDPILYEYLSRYIYIYTYFICLTVQHIKPVRVHKRCLWELTNKYRAIVSPTLHDDDDDDDEDDDDDDGDDDDDDGDDDDNNTDEQKVGEENKNTPNKMDDLNQQKWRIQQASRLC